ncbi:MAG: HRDC domain-containing protein [Acidimicrobiaceae bacterium]|nr:HRDC domain-containing protein [Acidimicrobiaceae bacterium]
MAAWRERRAMAIDSPVRQVLPDLAILGISQKQPTTVAELAQRPGRRRPPHPRRHRQGNAGSRRGGHGQRSVDAGRRRRRAGSQPAAGSHPGLGVGERGGPSAAHRHGVARHAQRPRSFLRGDADARLATVGATSSSATASAGWSRPGGAHLRRARRPRLIDSHRPDPAGLGRVARSVAGRQGDAAHLAHSLSKPPDTSALRAP